ncbi:MAG: NAD(P)H-dependent oxidoreductase subunit E [Peptococcaceae bacterium]|nr:NAD(P)H-dependent oxidoreductase subunit E [Peptococcaceae bacterium]
MSSTIVQDIIHQHGGDKALLLQVLLAVQDADPQKYLSEESVNEIARILEIPRSRVYSTASFYSEISLQPRGIYLIRVCTNAPCENAGKALVLQAIEKELGIGAGQTTSDGIFTVECVNCLGACYMSPAIKVNDVIYGDLTPEKAVKIIAELRKEYQDGQNTSGSCI